MEPLKLATRRASRELEALHARLERLEQGLDPAVLCAALAHDRQSLGMLQELDVLRQSLGALADYMAQITSETDPAGMVDPSEALRAVPLRDMALRLAGQDNADAESGHAELF